MPRASWRGFLRLSLVSCPIYLSPATSRTKPIRLHQVWRPASVEEPEDGFSDQVREKQLDERPGLRNDAGENADQTEGAARITLRPHTPPPARKSTRRRSSRAMNTTAASSSPSPPRS